MQLAFALRNRQLVVRARKVIHADELIAGAGQESDALLQDIQLLLRARQVGVFDFALGGEQVRHMRVVEHAEAIGIQLSHPLQRESEAFRRLFRQAVDQIDIGRAEAQRFGPLSGQR